MPKAALFLVQIDFEGLPSIVEEEANTVRYIYAMFIGGMTAHGIAKQLIKEKIPTPGSKKTWQANTVESIRHHERPLLCKRDGACACAKSLLFSTNVR